MIQLQITGDTNYLKLYHLQLLAGRIPVESDTTREFVINENYLHVLGFRKPEEALNKMVNSIPIVGVMADFHQESLHGPIKPLAFSGNLNNSYSFHIALQPQDAEGSSWKSTIAKIEMEYKQIYPEEEFTYEFFDESIAKFYKSEQDISQLLNWATGLAISCLPNLRCHCRGTGAGKTMPRGSDVLRSARRRPRGAEGDC